LKKTISFPKKKAALKMTSRCWAQIALTGVITTLEIIQEEKVCHGLECGANDRGARSGGSSGSSGGGTSCWDATTMLKAIRSDTSDQLHENLMFGSPRKFHLKIIIGFSHLNVYVIRKGAHTCWTCALNFGALSTS